MVCLFMGALGIWRARRVRTGPLRDVPNEVAVRAVGPRAAVHRRLLIWHDGFMLAPIAALLLSVAPTSATPGVKTKAATKVKASEKSAPLPHHLQAALAQLGEPLVLTSKERKQLGRVVAALKAGNDAAAGKQFAAVVQSTQQDISGLVMWVLRRSYIDSDKDLRFYADKVRSFNEVKKEVRSYLAGMRAELQGKPSTARLSGVELTVTTLAPGKAAVKRGKPRIRTVAQWGPQLDKLQEQLATIGDDAQLANIDLQSALQQQQTLQTISNVSKMLHDTAKAVINNLR